MITNISMVYTVAYAKFGSIKKYLSHFSKSFNIITTLKTWLKSERGMKFNLKGYECNCINRMMTPLRLLAQKLSLKQQDMFCDSKTRLPSCGDFTWLITPAPPNMLCYT